MDLVYEQLRKEWWYELLFKNQLEIRGDIRQMELQYLSGTVPWIPQPRPTKRLCQTIGKAYARTVREDQLDDNDTRRPEPMGCLVEEKLELHEGACRGLKKSQHR
eukprot:scaffold8353_cov138-Cylindrotheca_fusiformis.AAC.5